MLTVFRYNLNRRVHDVKTYPIQSPQGATILIYAYENGISLVWRGGRPLKRPKPNTNKGKQNGGSTDDAVMVIDSDDETPRKSSKSTVFVDKPEFEDAPTDELSSPPETVQTLDLALGTAALHVTVPPLAPSTAEDAAWAGSDILKERIVLAVACATNDVYVITLPLTPPSHESKARPELRKDLLAGVAGKGLWGETLTLLGGQTKKSDGVAMALVKQRQPNPERSRSVDRSGGPQPPSPARVVVAACAAEASGVLRFWDVNLESKPSTGRIEPFQAEYLPSPLKSISFNPSHSTQLLAVDSPHAIRIYDYAAPSLPEDISDGPFPTQGSWLLSLYPPFSQNMTMSTSRKPILDAAWVSHGCAVLALLADGQWGIWDIDGVAPSLPSGGGSGGLFGRYSSSIRGTGLTNFSASGYLEGTSALRNPGSQKSPAAPGSGEFVPMTPHTRRDALASSASGAVEKLAAVRGGIEVLHAQPLRASIGPTMPECAVLWIASADPIVAVIPGVSRFWDAQLRRGVGGGVNLFSGAQPTRMIRLTDLGAGLLGERCTGIAAIARQNRDHHDAATSTGTPVNGENTNSAEGLPIDVVVKGESRLVVVRESEDGAPVPNRLLSARNKPRFIGRSASAIITYPRLEKPSSVKFNLSVSRAGNRRASRQRLPVAGLFEPTSMDVLPSTEVDDDAGPPPARPTRDTGLAFMQSLNVAADVADEDEAQERNVEAEILDIMEIDRELEEMENERQSGRKHVFFEEG